MKCACGEPVAAGKYGLSGAARKAGKCYACYKAGRGAADIPAPAVQVASGSGAFTELDELVTGYAALMGEFSADANELLERTRRWVANCRTRVDQIRGTAAKVEAQVREAAAELRRNRKAAGEVLAQVRSVKGKLPDFKRGGAA